MKPEAAGLDGRTHRVDEWLTAGYGYCLAGVQWLEDRQTRFQHLQVGQHPGFGRFLRLDGALQCSEADEFFYHEPLVHTALLAAQQPARVLIVGGGDGGAAEEALKWGTVQQLSHVEIDPEVVDASRRHLQSVHRGVLDGTDRRYTLTVADAATWLDRGGIEGACDALILDLTDPGGPSSPLYSVPFYRRCRQALAAGGAMTLHIASPWAHGDTCAQTVARLRQVFPAVLPYQVQVPLSGGAWLMALCMRDEPPPWLKQPPARRQAVDVSVAQRLSQLRGPALKALSPAIVAAQFELPPYLSTLLQAAQTNAHPAPDPPT